MSVRWTLRTRTGPSRSETGGLTRRSADVKTDEEFLSVFAFLKIDLPKFEIFTVLFRSRAEFTERL